jgi:hypothetical protein
MQGQQRALHFVEYDDLLDNPQDTMEKIYDFLEEDYFKHDFANLVNIHQENDGQVYGMADMHDVRTTLGRRGINPAEILSETIINKCKNAEFWRTMNEEIPQEEFLPDNELPITQENPSFIIGA